MFLIFLFGVLSLCSGQLPEPKYAVNLDSELFIIGDKSSIDISGITCERYNETTASMFGEVNYVEEMNHLSIEIIVEKETSGQFSPILTHDICDFCKEMADEDSQYKSFMKDLAIPERCPFKPGKVQVENYIVNLDDHDIEVSEQHIGRYFVQLKGFQSDSENCNHKLLLLFHLGLYFTIARQD